MKPAHAVALLFLLIAMPSKHLHGQYTSYGNDPWRQHWRKITTAHLTVIYPETIDSMARRYTWLLDTAYVLDSHTIGHKSRRIPVILHPDNVNSNGSVVWAPRRMELMTTPSFDLYPESWDKQLAIHESRHVAQIDKLNSKTMRLAYYLFGEQSSALWLLPIPTWFLEGDAVAAETGITSSGRGRLPEFHMPYRAYFLSGAKWKYDKWLNGSYKHLIPNIYPFGYEQVSYARFRWGGDIWDKVLTEVSRRYFKIPTFSNALKKYTGITSTQLQEQTFDFLTQQWAREDSTITVDSSIQYLTPEESTYVNYRSPVVLNDSTVVGLKTGLAHAPSMAFISTDGTEERLLDFGYINGRPQLYREKLYWSENVRDVRWSQQSYAEVKAFDLKTKNVDKLTKHARYIALAFSDSLNCYAASTYTREGLSAVCLISSETNTEQKRYATPNNGTATELAWINEGRALAVRMVTERGVGIYQLDTLNGQWSVILKEATVNLSGLSAYKEYLLFESGYNGVNNIYALQLASKQIYQLSSSRFGAFDPTVVSAAHTGKPTLYFSDYQKNGYRLAKKELDSLTCKAVSWDKPYRFMLADTLSAQEGASIDTMHISDGKKYESEPYQKALHLFRFHSWTPFYMQLSSDVLYDPSRLITAIKPGLTLLSQNSLSTAVTRLGYAYENGYSAGHASFTYSGWYPIVELTGDYGGGKRLLIKDGGVVESTQNRYDVGLNVYIPFIVNGTRYLRGAIPQLQLHTSNTAYYVPSETLYKNALWLDASIQTYAQSRMAVCDIFPRWGYNLTIESRSLPFDRENFGSISAARLAVYIPGLFVSHGLKLSTNLQYQKLKRYYMSSLIDFPRGYATTPSQMLQVYSADYSFPIAYPDFSIGPLLYFKRFKLNMFADYGRNSYFNQNIEKATNMFSYGVDITADYHIIQQEFPFVTGVRLVKPMNGNLSAQIIFGISF